MNLHFGFMVIKIFISISSKKWIDLSSLIPGSKQKMLIASPLYNLLQASEIIVEFSDDQKNLTSNWQFALLELSGSHYASICKKKDDNNTVQG